MDLSQFHQSCLFVPNLEFFVTENIPNRMGTGHVLKWVKKKNAGSLNVLRAMNLMVNKILWLLILVSSGLAKSYFDLLVRFLPEVFFTCPYHIYIVNF